VKIDMSLLKTHLKNTAADCSTAKQTFKMFQRQKDWKQVGRWRAEAGALSEHMTKLCVFKAHLRGRTHLTANSVYADLAAGWIAELTPRYQIAEAKIAG
jgi:alkylhydroperoxidase family enzyme